MQANVQMNERKNERTKQANEMKGTLGKLTLFSSNTRKTSEANLDGSPWGKNCLYILRKPCKRSMSTIWLIILNAFLQCLPIAQLVIIIIILTCSVSCPFGQSFLKPLYLFERGCRCCCCYCCGSSFNVLLIIIKINNSSLYLNEKLNVWKLIYKLTIGVSPFR